MSRTPNSKYENFVKAIEARGFKWKSGASGLGCYDIFTFEEIEVVAWEFFNRASLYHNGNFLPSCQRVPFNRIITVLDGMLHPS